MSETPRETAQAWCEKHAEHKSVPGTTFVSGRLLCSRDDVVQLLQPLVAERDALLAQSEQARSDRDEAISQCVSIGRESKKLEAERDALRLQANQLELECGKAQNALATLARDGNGTPWTRQVARRTFAPAEEKK